MKFKNNLIAGFAGAVALNILHETVRQLDADAPRIELIGEEALSKSLRKAGIAPPTGDALYFATLGADILSNAWYYSLIGIGKKKDVVPTAVVYGTVAGLGALLLTRPLGLNDAPVTRTTRTKLMTVGYYLFGAMVTAAVLRNKD